MHPLFKLKDTRLDEAHQTWIGRDVRDRYGRHLGHVKEILVEERTMEEACQEDQDPEGWAARADFAVVAVETGMLDRIRARHVVMVPIASLREQDGVLVADEDGDAIRVALAS